MQKWERQVGARRQWLQWMACGSLLGLSRLGHAAAEADWRPPMVTLEGVYVPALFLTGSGGKSAEAGQRARAAMQRLAQTWLTLRPALAGLWPRDAAWQRSMGQVQRHIDEGAQQTQQGAWAAAHEALEHVREVLAQARQAKGLVFLPDRYTAFHAEMEGLVGASSAPALDRAALRLRYTRARGLWQGIVDAGADPMREGLTPARRMQQDQALAEETAALSRLSQALDGADDAALRQGLSALKAPFVRAYTAFGRELES